MDVMKTSCHLNSFPYPPNISSILQMFHINIPRTIPAIGYIIRKRFNTIIYNSNNSNSTASRRRPPPQICAPGFFLTVYTNFYFQRSLYHNDVHSFRDKKQNLGNYEIPGPEAFVLINPILMNNTIIYVVVS